MSSPALFVTVLIVCLVVPIGMVWWLWIKEPPEPIASIGIAAAVIFAVVLICWAVAASWLATLGILCAIGFCAAMQSARFRMFDAIDRWRAKKP